MACGAAACSIIATSGRSCSKMSANALVKTGWRPRSAAQCAGRPCGEMSVCAIAQDSSKLTTA
eukprot:6135150-Prymnesium_polylepis.2